MLSYASGVERICGSFYCAANCGHTRYCGGGDGSSSGVAGMGWQLRGRRRNDVVEGIVKILHIVFALRNCYFYDLVCEPPSSQSTTRTAPDIG